MPLTEQTRSVNLSQLWWNTRGKSQKNVVEKGRDQVHHSHFTSFNNHKFLGDCDIVVSAAPDSQNFY